LESRDYEAQNIVSIFFSQKQNGGAACLKIISVGRHFVFILNAMFCLS
jgi:hypothetical protein